MTAIQLVLVVASLLWIVRFLSRLRSRRPARLLAVLAAAVAVALVVFPDLSVRLAHLVGVARGVDLVIYLAFVAVGFAWLHVVGRLSSLEEKLQQLVRASALDELPAARPELAPPAGADEES